MLKKIGFTTLLSFVFAVATPAIAYDYLANPRSMLFHYASCRTIKKLDILVRRNRVSELVEL